MTLTDISNIRLISQKIEDSDYKTAKEVVGWMGAMQAQDYAMSKWAIGIRLKNSTEANIESAINKGEIIRTHLMRPTWHFVSADDVYWILELTAPQIKSSMKSRHKELELTETNIIQANKLIENTISKGTNVTREEIAKEFNAAKIRTDDNRLAHFLMIAELEGIICSGIPKVNKPTYAMLAERVPYKKILSREESLAELAKRYFTSHCPATIKDFVWWSGLSLKDAKLALELTKSEFIAETIGSEKYWLIDSFSGSLRNRLSVHLMPAYDEFLISYRDRAASLSLADNKKTVSVNGIFRPTIVVNGLVVGLWKRITKKDKVIIEIEFFQQQKERIRNQIRVKASKYGSFLKKEIEVSFETELQNNC